MSIYEASYGSVYGSVYVSVYWRGSDLTERITVPTTQVFPTD